MTRPDPTQADRTQPDSTQPDPTHSTLLDPRASNRPVIRARNYEADKRVALCFTQKLTKKTKSTVNIVEHERDPTWLSTSSA